MSDEILTELGKYVNKSILIKLKNHKTIKGILINFDSQMNLVLDKVEDVTNGDKKTEGLDKRVLRGDNILIISLSSEWFVT
ncbi:putative snRNP Sm-like protein [Marine Group I thaumarchaeote SCGC AAA799-E16]|uniref:Putative snRNP Sm-like protein n=4 Tax=Marine Group I TaxID=905826 RepID=A0A081RL98_9ARCH|nr:Putative snRNP Sm-like protein [Marine Group I thaumarchaeote SCGC AAA799-N04]KER05549.1 putative snRNP Sm-like protein [Marine Group I thaumarchaeote SCGC AAA799-E16]KFM15616.1 putative snRNP Sm-like protein [Marine Group I thaumarchaeote SCGC AAA799-D11]KFM15779.1 putative snRNP Sm-like protein [Marine Group I thaumarchaeote SCGC RSA3]